MIRDTEDVVALPDEAIEAAAKQLRAVLDEGYDDECALSSALEMLGVETKLQSLSDRIDVLEGLAGDVRWQELAEGAPFTVIDRMMLRDMYAAARAALHQEGIAP